ncbi:MAG TPA: AAA family ATPase [Pseudonocardiaceae bacterium]|nr:AAA family ATPase [Pseudonocardiaceae bacterium]
MAFFERHEALAALTTSFAGCVAGRGSVVLVSGAPGSGKTCLAHAFGEHARERGALVLAGAGSRVEQGLPMGVLEQLFRSAELPADDVERLDRAYERVIAAGTDVRPAPEAIGALHLPFVHALCTALLAQARRRPVVIVVDDVGFADRVSLGALLYVQRRLTRAAVMMVLVGGEAAHRSRRFWAEAGCRPGSLRIRVPLLSAAGVAEMLAERVAAPPAELVAACHAMSGGNPLLLSGLVADLTSDGGAEAGEAFGDAFLACLRRAEPVLHEVIRGVAVLEGDATPAMLAELLETEPAAAAAAVESLDAAGLLHTGRFRCPQARAAVLRDLPPERRSALHRRAAVLLRAKGAGATEIAHHAAAAAIEEHWVVDVFADAADAALAQRRADLALEYLEQAERLAPDERASAALTAAQARTRWRHNPAAVPQGLGRLQAAFHAGYLDHRDAVALAGYLIWHGHPADAAGVLGRVAKLAGSDPLRAADLQLMRDWLRHSYPAGGDAAEPGTPAGRWQPGRTARAATARAEQVLRCGRLGETAIEELVPAVTTLLATGSAAAAKALCDRLALQARERREVTWTAVLADLCSAAAFHLGDLVAAEQHARVALSSMPAHGWGAVIGSPLANLVNAATAMGKLDLAARHLDEVLPPAAPETAFWPRYLHARGRYHLARGNLYAAHDDLQACGAVVRDWNTDDPAIVPWRGDLAQVCVRLGQYGTARRLVTEQLDRLGGEANRVHGISLRVLASASDSLRRLQILTQSAELLQQAGDQFELAVTLTDLSDAYFVLGESATARLTARRASQLARWCNAEGLSRRLLPGSVGPGAPAGTPVPPVRCAELGTLSDSERRVAVLAALGHSNREVGRRLYITVSTVEQHLTRIYRKLGIKGRDELPPTLLPTAPPDTN